MGKEKYASKIGRLFDRSPIVSFSQIQRVINDKRKVKQYAKKFVGYLVARGEVKRLTKGYYTKLDDPSLVVFCFQPSYLGLQDALSMHNLWEQETIPVIITSRKAEPGIRKVMGKNILIRRIEKRYIFGIEYKQEGKFAYPYSDIEKTFIDMVYFKEKMDKDLISEFGKKIDERKLNSYLKVYPQKIRDKVRTSLGG